MPIVTVGRVRTHSVRIVLLVGALSLLAVAFATVVPATSAAPLSGSLSVVGNHLQANGAVVVPRGVNRSGTEYACVQGWGIFDGPSDSASVAAMATWGIRSVRIPLNEDCWLGINGVPAAYSGANYINAIVAYVNLLHANGMYAELSLIWGAPGTTKATSQGPAPDADHSPAFWTSLATTFKSDGDVVLSPYGEPHNLTWTCLRDGGSSCGTGYTVAGMQQAVTLMRAAGYHGPISIPGIDYANNLTQWLSFKPTDPDNALMAEAHIYGKNTCMTTACFDSQIAPVAAVVPTWFAETGETYDGSDCNNSSTNISTFMGWADTHDVGYMAWTWDTWGACNLSLITAYDGAAYGVYGNYVKTHLLAMTGAPTPTPTTPPTISPTPPPSGHFVAMGFAIGWQMPKTPPWGDITQEALFALQTTAGTSLDEHFLNGVNVPAFTADAHTHGVQALITIGGSADQHWQDACVGTNRPGFISNLVNYMVTNGFDGIDLDIEDNLWASQGPPSPDMTACIEAISTAAKATKTKAGNVPLITADVITNWEGGWFAPSQASVDQFNLMTYGDTTGGSLQADVQATINQGLPKSKFVPGIDVIDAPGTANQCKPFSQYAVDNGLMGAFVWDESTDEAHSYPCFHEFAPFIGGTPPPPTPTPTPSPPPPTPTPTGTPPPPPVFAAGPALSVAVAFSGGAGSNVVLSFIVTDPANHIVTKMTSSRNPMPTGTVILNKTFSALGEAPGTKLTVEAKVVDAVTSVVYYDNKSAETLTVP